MVHCVQYTVQQKTQKYWINYTTTPCLKNVPPLASYNFDTHEWILLLFGRNVTDKVGNQKTPYYAILHHCVSALYLAKRGNAKITFSLSWIMLHTMHLCAVFLKEKVVICDVWR